jgi:hypothetical protein
MSFSLHTPQHSEPQGNFLEGCSSLLRRPAPRYQLRVLQEIAYGSDDPRASEEPAKFRDPLRTANGEARATVKLQAYDPRFEMGATLEEASGPVSLNHPFCASFCVLGGASCSR